MDSNKDVLRVDYVVVKINGNDISQMPRYEAVQAFLQAKDKIVVELCRRKHEFDDSLSIEKLQLSNITDKKLENDSASSSDISKPIYNKELILTLQAENSPTEAEYGTQTHSFATKETQTDENSIHLVHSTQQQNLAREIADRLIEQEHHLFEQCLEPEIDIEEITLSKTTDSKESLGVTVCSSGVCSTGSGSNYSGAGVSTEGNDVCTEVFISNIEPESIAERDGRLRRGDLILQINGKNVKNIEETEKLISENSNSVTLLVSRYLYPGDEPSDDDDDEYYVENSLDYANGFLVNDYRNVVDKLGKALLTQTSDIDITETKVNPLASEINAEHQTSMHSVDVTHTENVILNKKEGFSNSKLQSLKPVKPHSKSHEKGATLEIESAKVMLPGNAALVKKTEKILNTTAPVKKYDYDDTEHIYETIAEDSESEPFYCSPYQSSTYMTAIGSCSSATANDALELQQQKQRVAQWLGIKSQHAVSMHVISNASGEISDSLQGNRTTITQRSSSKVGNTLQSAITNTTSGSSSSGAGCGQTVCDKVTPVDEIENSSSAYNTGGSNNSVPPLSKDNETAINIKSRLGNNTIFNKIQRLQPPKEVTAVGAKANIMLFTKFLENPTRNLRTNSAEDQQQIVTRSNNKNEPNGGSQKQAQQYFRGLVLQQQQKQYDQHLANSAFNAPNLSQYHFVSSQEVSTMNLTSPKTCITTNMQKKVSEDTPMVWKVKRRPDGTRYIVRRPVRNRLPVNVRKNVRNNEVTTTEDDTVSEVKIGRYWSKEERKKHIERARERRNLQQQHYQVQ